MGFGTFDGIHPGHLDYFRQLKSLGDELVIVIARDKNVEKIKGSPPLYNEESRLNGIRQIKLVDTAVLGNETDFYQVIREYLPSIIGLGYDQKANTGMLTRLFPGIKVIRLKAFEPEKHKSSLLRIKN